MSDTKRHPRRSLGSGLSRWASHTREEAQELQRDSERAGLLCIADAPDREMVTIQGKLKTVGLRPRGGVPALEADLYDGSGSVLLLWLGRRRIAGISPGQTLRVTGRIGRHEGERVLYNPRYEIRP